MVELAEGGCVTKGASPSSLTNINKIGFIWQPKGEHIIVYIANSIIMS